MRLYATFLFIYLLDVSKRYVKADIKLNLYMNSFFFTDKLIFDIILVYTPYLYCAEGLFSKPRISSTGSSEGKYLNIW